MHQQIVSTSTMITLRFSNRKPTVAANSARDVGARLMALTIWGKQASGGTYAAIAALTNIPATIAAAVVYELLHHDSSRGKSHRNNRSYRFTHQTRTVLVVAPGQQAYLSAHKAHLDRRLGASQSDYQHGPKTTNLETGQRDESEGSADDKARVEMRE
jgi:hypothetical protein